MYSEGPSEGKKTVTCTSEIFCSLTGTVNHYYRKELLLWLEVTQAGLLGWHKGSQHVFWPLLLAPSATITKTVAWASTWPLSLALEGNHKHMCIRVRVHTHITVHESWPRFPMRVLACHLTKPNNSSEQMPGFQGQTDGWAKWLWIRITLLTHKGSLGFWLSGCYVFR